MLSSRELEVDVLQRDTRRSELIEGWGAKPCKTAGSSSYEIVVEAAGTEDAVQAALRAVAPGGSIALLGVQGRLLDNVDVDALVLKDACIIGVLNGPGLYDSMLSEIAAGNVRSDILVDREFALEDAPAAFAYLASRGRVRPKVLLRVSDDSPE